MKFKKVLITGGVGFLGTHFVRYLSNLGGYEIVVFDKLKCPPENYNENVIYFKGDIRLEADIKKVFKTYGPFFAVYHLAASQPNKADSDYVLWETNVTGTVNLAAEAVKNKVKSFIFTSSNVVYGIPSTLPATEKTILAPLEIYGKSKVQAEKELAKFKNKINIQIFRCPVITGTERLGLQAILYEFILENRNIYVLGDGLNKYQFVDAADVCTALEKVSHLCGFDIYNIGAPEVLTLREIYQRVINYAQSTTKIISLPKTLSLIILVVLDKLNISPLGIYQYTMISRSLYEDTTKIEKKLAWKPKKTNACSFIENCKWYRENKAKFTKIGSGAASSNRSLPKMGILKLLKMFS